MGKIIARAAIYTLVFVAGYVVGVGCEYDMHKDAIEAYAKNEAEEQQIEKSLLLQKLFFFLRT